MNYLSVHLISKALTNANNRNELRGNVQTLQKLTTYDGISHSYFSGASVRRSIRSGMQALHLADPATYPAPFRWQDAPETEGGYVYGPGRSKDLEHAPLSSPADYPDTAFFGYMLKANGSGKDGKDDESETKTKKVKKAVDPNAVKAANQASSSPLSVSRFVACTPLTGDIGFRLGVKGGGEHAPFCIEEHFARFHGSFTLNMGDLIRSTGPERAKVYTKTFLDALSHGLVIGGNHAAHGSQFIADLLIVWEHNCPASGLVFDETVTEKWTSNKPLPLEDIKQYVALMGVKANFYGLATGQSVPDAWNAMKATVLG